MYHCAASGVQLALVYVRNQQDGHTEVFRKAVDNPPKCTCEFQAPEEHCQATLSRLRALLKGGGGGNGNGGVLDICVARACAHARHTNDTP